MSFDPLIDNLVGDLTPRSSLTFRRLEIYATALFAAALILLLGTLKIRPDYKEAMQTGALMWKPGIFFLSAISGILLLAASTLPGRTIKNAYYLPMIIAGLFLSFIFARTVINSDIKDFIATLTDRRAPFCLVIVTMLGGMILTALWYLWLNKSAPANSRHAGMMAGLSSGLIASSAYAFHCTQDNPIYLLVYYGVPIILLGLIGSYAGKKHLNW